MLEVYRFLFTTKHHLECNYYCTIRYITATKMRLCFAVAVVIAADVDDVIIGGAFEFPTLHLELELAILAISC